MTDTKPPEGVRDHEAWADLKLLDERGEGLTQWEIDFVEDLHGYLRRGLMLTEKQRRMLSQLIDDRVG